MNRFKYDLNYVQMHSNTTEYINYYRRNPGKRMIHITLQSYI